MVRVKFKPNIKGFYEIRSLDSLVAIEEQLAAQMAAKANELDGTDEYLTSSRQGRKNPQGRWRTTVVTGGNHAKRANARHNTLLKVLGGAQ